MVLFCSLGVQYCKFWVVCTCRDWWLLRPRFWGFRSQVYDWFKYKAYELRSTLTCLHSQLDIRLWIHAVWILVVVSKWVCFVTFVCNHLCRQVYVNILIRLENAFLIALSGHLEMDVDIEFSFVLNLVLHILHCITVCNIKAHTRWVNSNKKSVSR